MVEGWVIPSRTTKFCVRLNLVKGVILLSLCVREGVYKQTTGYRCSTVNNLYLVQWFTPTSLEKETFKKSSRYTKERSIPLRELRFDNVTLMTRRKKKVIILIFFLKNPVVQFGVSGRPITLRLSVERPYQIYHTPLPNPYRYKESTPTRTSIP